MKCRLKLYYTVGLLVCFSLSSCFHEKPAEPPVTDNISTSNIIFNIINNSIFFINNQNDEALRLGSADSLMVYADGVQLPLTEVRDISCAGVVCRYYYQYRFSLSENPFAAYEQIVIALERTIGVSALNTTIDISSSPVFSSPSPGDVISISNDNLSISVLYNSPQSTFDLVARGTCITGDVYTLVSGQNDFVIPAGALSYYDYTDSQFRCADQTVFDLKVQAIMRGVITIDSAFNSGRYTDFIYRSGPDMQVTL